MTARRSYLNLPPVDRREVVPLQRYRDRGRLRLTAYERFYTWTTGPAEWRLVCVNERLSAEVVGPPFESETEALKALPTLARANDCIKAR